MPAIHYEKIELPADFSLDVTEMTLEPNYDMLGRMHWHDCFEISAINGGEGTYVVDNTGYPVKSGDIVVLNNIEPHQKVLETGAKFDFAHYWEDICFNNAPQAVLFRVLITVSCPVQNLSLFSITQMK